MNDPIPLDDLIADDLLLDRLAGRQPAGDEPVAALLCAVAAHAEARIGPGPNKNSTVPR